MNSPFTLHLPFDGTLGNRPVPLVLELQPLASGLSATLRDLSRGQDANPIAHFRVYSDGSRTVLELEPWDELNAGNGGTITHTLYDLREPNAEARDEPTPGVLLHLEDGVLMDACSNILGLDLRVFDPELLDDQDAESATTSYPWDFAPLTSADHWAKYETAYTDDNRKLAVAEHFLGEDAA